MHTGFSGGGIPTWYLAMSHPEVFTMLCFRRANYYGPSYFSMTRNVGPWLNRPVYVYWGENDHDLIIKPRNGHPGDGPWGSLLLQQMGCRNVKHEILAGGGHAGRADLASQWFDEVKRQGQGR